MSRMRGRKADALRSSAGREKAVCIAPPKTDSPATIARCPARVFPRAVLAIVAGVEASAGGRFRP